MSALTVSGKLNAAHACVAGREGKDAVLVFEIDGGSGWPLEARWFAGTAPEDHTRARELMATFSRGNLIHVDADRIEPRTDFGAATLVLRGITAIRCGAMSLKA